MKSLKPRMSRRRFLLAASTAGAATGAALVSRNAAHPTDRAQAREAGEKTGYRLTEHVRNYYRTARL